LFDVLGGKDQYDDVDVRLLRFDRADAPTNAQATAAPADTAAGASGAATGTANVGLWVRTPAEYEWLRDYLTVKRFRELLTESTGLAVHRYELPNLLAVNFVIVGLLGNGVADSTRPDPQAKGLGEYVRSRHVDLPTAWLTGAGS
jgi:hypothetical protein